MKIYFSLNDLSLKLFPNLNLNSSVEDLRTEIINYFSKWGMEVSVNIVNEVVEVELLWSESSDENSLFNSAVSYAERQRYTEAKSNLDILIKNKTKNSEVYRIYGQILSDEWNISKSEDYLLQSLTLNPKNENALIMLWNIYRSRWSDLTLTEHLYKQAIEVNPNNLTVLCNLSALYYQKNDINEAWKYIDKAYGLSPIFPLALYYKAVIESEKWNYLEAFNFASKCYGESIWNPQLENPSLNVMNNVAEKYATSFNVDEILNSYKKELEEKGWKNISVQTSSNLNVMAKIEIAEAHWRDEHILIYRTSEISYKHLMMHELVHLDLIIQAREVANNKFFVRNEDNVEKFLSDFQKEINKIAPKIWKDQTNNIFKSLLMWTALQLFNWPLDLIIEDFLYKKYPELRPIQFLSLRNNLLTAQKWIESEVKDIMPIPLLNAHLIMNTVNAFQFKDLFWVDLTKVFWLWDIRKTAEELFKKYKKNRNTRKAWEEYDDVNNWAKLLKFNRYIWFVNDYTVNSQVDTKDNETTIDDVESFIKSLEWKTVPKDLDYAVIMYCVGAIKFFKNLSQEQIKIISYEIALLWSKWIDQDSTEEKYSLQSLPWKKFSWRHILAYYFVWFQLIESGQNTWLNRHQEYEIAKKIAG